MNAIEVNHLKKSFGDFQAVQDASFTADSGEVLRVLGPNGAGKSTTISMLSGLLHPTDGDACIMGYSVIREPDYAKASLGVVPQDIVHFGDVSLVGYTSGSEKSHILLAQFPLGTHVDVNTLLKQISKGSGQPDSVWYNTEATLIDEHPVLIRGDECTLNINEGTSSEGTTYRSAVATFEGRGGPALVLISTPLDEWDMELVDAFIASIQ